jgi:hypothetical protein
MKRTLRVTVACLAVAFAAAAGAATKGRAASAPAPAVAASAAAAPIEFAGQFEVDRTYVAEVAYDANALHVWRPVKDVQVVANTGWTVEWVNIAQFPALATPATRAKVQRFRFKVLKADVSSGSLTMPWTTFYRCELLAVEPVAGPTPSPAKKR